MVLTVSFVLSLVTGLFCHHHSQDARGVFTNLAPASGRQNHTTSPSACTVSRLPTRRVHRIPLPTFVTTAKRPSYRERDAQCNKSVSTKSPSAKFLRQALDTTSARAPDGQITFEKIDGLRRILRAYPTG
jgi:hypothetical protein